MNRFLSVVAPLVWAALFFLGWQWFVVSRHVQLLVLPPPTKIFSTLLRLKSLVFDAATATATNAIIGLVAGVIAGVMMAFAAQRFPALRSMLTPISAAFNTMPIVALGPVFYNLYGATSEGARRVVVALVAFFPVFVNVLKGLTQVDPVHQELMRSYAASDTQFLRRVRLPNALPFLVTGIRVAASLAVIAAVVVEYFGGLQNGLGSRVASAMKLSQTPKAWAYIASAILMGLLFYVAGLLFEIVSMPWNRRRLAADR
jgi:NitT/TauT family transport system permease protein